MVCKKVCLEKINKKYKCVLANLINEKDITTAPSQLKSLGYDLLKQSLTTFTNLMHSERGLFAALVNLDSLEKEIPALLPYTFKVSETVGIIYTFKLGPSRTTDFYMYFEEGGMVVRRLISLLGLDPAVQLSLYNLMERNANIEQYRITSGKTEFAGCKSTSDDLTVEALNNIFYRFSDTTKYRIYVLSYEDKYGFKYSNSTYYF